MDFLWGLGISGICFFFGYGGSVVSLALEVILPCFVSWKGCFGVGRLKAGLKVLKLSFLCRICQWLSSCCFSFLIYLSLDVPNKSIEMKKIKRFS